MKRKLYFFTSFVLFILSFFLIFPNLTNHANAITCTYTSGTYSKLFKCSSNVGTTCSSITCQTTTCPTDSCYQAGCTSCSSSSIGMCSVNGTTATCTNSAGGANCPTYASGTCASSYCVGTTLYSGVYCSGSSSGPSNYCSYSTSTPNSSSCGGGPTPTPTKGPTPTPTKGPTPTTGAGPTPTTGAGPTPTSPPAADYGCNFCDSNNTCESYWSSDSTCGGVWCSSCRIVCTGGYNETETPSSLTMLPAGSGQFNLSLTPWCTPNQVISNVTLSAFTQSFAASGAYCSYYPGASQLACKSASIKCAAAGDTNCRTQSARDTMTYNYCDAGNGSHSGRIYNSSCTVVGNPPVAPILGSCPNLGTQNATCTVNGNNSSPGAYNTNITASNTLGNNTFPLTVTISTTGPASISYTCTYVTNPPYRNAYTGDMILLTFDNFGGARYYCAYFNGKLGACTTPAQGSTTTSIVVDNSMPYYFPDGTYTFDVYGYTDSNMTAQVSGYAEVSNVTINQGVCTTPTPILTYTISGLVFVDLNSDGINAGESTYTANPAISITSTGGTVTYPAAGNYQIANLPAGQYTVTYTNPPTANGYTVTYPKGVGNPSFLVTVGPACTTNANKNAVCDAGGNITALDFGITNAIPWMQSIGGDITGVNFSTNGGFNDQIPSPASPPSCQPYASVVPGGATTPGIVYAGATTPNFGQGTASVNNWSVGTSSYPEVYTPPIPNTIKTSYNYITALAQSSSAVPTTICAGGGNCTLPFTPGSHGVYIIPNSITLTGSGSPAQYTFPVNGQYVILVNGDLHINTQIHVPNGGSVLFTASGNITVDTSVGESSPSSPTWDLEGYYSADKNFTVEGTKVCPTVDRRLNVAGAIVANASLQSFSFTYNRDLCAADLQCPVFSITERPDFILNSTEFLKPTRRVWQEIAP